VVRCPCLFGATKLAKFLKTDFSECSSTRRKQPRISLAFKTLTGVLLASSVSYSFFITLGCLLKQPFQLLLCHWLWLFQLVKFSQLCFRTFVNSHTDKTDYFIVGKAPRVLLSIARRQKPVEEKRNAAPIQLLPTDYPLPGLDAFNPIKSKLAPRFLGFVHSTAQDDENENEDDEDQPVVHSAVLEAQNLAKAQRFQDGRRLFANAENQPELTVPLHILTSTSDERLHESNSLRTLYYDGFISEDEYRRRVGEISLAESSAREPVIPSTSTTIPSSPLNDSLSDPIERSIESRQIRVFVSSTFADMKEEREVLLGQIFPALAAVCKQRGVSFSAVDLRWGITTDQSQQGETINICLREIDRCRPYFVSVLGGRYGWAQQPGASDELLTQTFSNASASYPWLKEYEDRSITELEIRHAVLNDPSNSTAKRAQFYFRSLSAAEEQTQDLRLARLKSEVSASPARVAAYSRAADLGSLVYNDLLRLIDIDFPATFVLLLPPNSCLSSQMQLSEKFRALCIEKDIIKTSL
jgi:hypothetical protein